MTYLIGLAILGHEVVIAKEPRWALFPIVAGMIGLGEFVPLLAGMFGKRDGNGDSGHDEDVAPPVPKKKPRGKSMFSIVGRFA